ncbi:AcoA Pyruvate/2-oxoglutarate dehydrogenase complex, dehydrogenase (E1) component, eukaryotic type, alpha subunit [Candidatus Pelagibacterales bacterium]|jgi:pyruvate dehydrogenase E1 component alpha subunit
MKNFLIKSLIKIIEIRRTEELIAEDYKKNNIKSFLHLAVGQEATAVGVAMATTKNDFFFGNHRSHGHYLSKDGDWKKMIYEIYGDKRGCCKGYGGSMHMLDRKVGFVGSTPILGSAAPIAAGIAAAKKFKNHKNEIVVVFIGDGAAEEGAFYETVNLAGLYKLPLLIILEDNLYSVETGHQNRKTKKYNFENIFKRGFGVLYEEVNGQDVFDVFKKTKKMKKNILKKKMPAILHCKVRRKFAHSGTDIDLNKKYRKQDNLKIFEANDPINILRKYSKTYKIKESILNEIINACSKKIEKKFIKIRKTIKVR